jgi:AraC-like DNA-binding protein
VRLYERATVQDKPSPFLHARKGYTFWAAPAGYLDLHRGAAPVLLAGLYGKFRLRLPGTPWMPCHAAIIPPGLPHELDFHGEPFAALYIEPNLGGLHAVSALMDVSGAAQSASIGVCTQISVLRSLFEDRSGCRWAGEAFGDLLAFSKRKIDCATIDPRIAASLDLMQESASETANLERLAQAAGISQSRFQHLFTQQVGVPFRRYRIWQKLRVAWQKIAQGATSTEAAHASGFFDSAHFAHEYRKTFGKASSQGVTLDRLSR